MDPEPKYVCRKKQIATWYIWAIDFFTHKTSRKQRDYTRNKNQTFFEGDNEMGY